MSRLWSSSAWPNTMKETPLSNCERRFLLRAIEEKKVRGLRCALGGFVCRLGLPAGWTPVARGFIVSSARGVDSGGSASSPSLGPVFYTGLFL